MKKYELIKIDENKKNKINKRNIINSSAIILLAVIIIGIIKLKILNRYESEIVIQICYNIILAVSLNLVAGFLGQLPLGQAGFMAIGAYSSALITMTLELPKYIEFPIAILAGGLIASAFGIIIGLPALRLKGDYLAIITLGFGEIIRVIITNLKITGGATGLRGIEKYTTIEWSFFIMILIVFLIYTLIKSRHGRAIMAIREDEFVAELTGIPVTYYKVFTFALSAFFTGIAGALYAHNICFLDASNFGFLKSVDILLVVVLGGLGSLFGSIFSAISLTLLPELLRGLLEYRMVIYAVLLIIIMLFKPSGLFGRYEFSLTDSLRKFYNFIFNDSKTEKKSNEGVSDE